MIPCPGQAVIFDFDGVVVDSRSAWRIYFDRLRAELGLGPMSDADLEFMFIHTTREAVERLFPAGKLDLAWAAIDKIDMAEIATLIPTMPGLIDYLDALAKAGIHTALNTNGGAESYPVLRRHRLDERFELIVTADDVPRPKPHPDGALAILNHFRLGPDQAVFLGDSVMDQRAARAAGIEFWAYNAPDLEADRRVSDYADLIREIKAL